jgi:hypothetical protein
VLNELDGLLAESDTAAIALFEKHSATLLASTGLACEQLEKQLKAFDFNAARETLRVMSH